MRKTEIERKFLVEVIAFDIEKYPKKRYVQGYISTSPTIRLRDEDGKYVLCVKSEGKLSREEFEAKISKAQFDRLWEKIETSPVVKDRHFIPLKCGLTAELDIYHGALAGLAVVEVEFETEGEAIEFVPPEWFGKDVTYDSRYKNASLAVCGLPV